MRQMTDQEARDFLAHNKAGVLCLASGGRAYGIPLFYGYDGRALYFHVHPGLKVEYADATEEACFTIARVMGLDDWASAQVFGRLEEVGMGPERIVAHQALMSVPLPPEWGESAFGEPRRGPEGAITYRLLPTRLAGRYSQSPRGSREEREIAFGGM